MSDEDDVRCMRNPDKTHNTDSMHCTDDPYKNRGARLAAPTNDAQCVLYVATTNYGLINVYIEPMSCRITVSATPILGLCKYVNTSCSSINSINLYIGLMSFRLTVASPPLCDLFASFPASILISSNSTVALANPVLRRRPMPSMPLTSLPLPVRICPFMSIHVHSCPCFPHGMDGMDI